MADNNQYYGNSNGNYNPYAGTGNLFGDYNQGNAPNNAYPQLPDNGQSYQNNGYNYQDQANYNYGQQYSNQGGYQQYGESQNYPYQQNNGNGNYGNQGYDNYGNQGYGNYGNAYNQYDGNQNQYQQYPNNAIPNQQVPQQQNQQQPQSQFQNALGSVQDKVSKQIGAMVVQNVMQNQQQQMNQRLGGGIGGGVGGAPPQGGPGYQEPLLGPVAPVNADQYIKDNERPWGPLIETDDKKALFLTACNLIANPLGTIIAACLDEREFNHRMLLIGLAQLFLQYIFSKILLIGNIFNMVNWFYGMVIMCRVLYFNKMRMNALQQNEQSNAQNRERQRQQDEENRSAYANQGRHGNQRRN